VNPIQLSISGVIVPLPSEPCPPKKFSGTQPEMAAQVSTGPSAILMCEELKAPCFI
jgi:hypothetical protein